MKHETWDDDRSKDALEYCKEYVPSTIGSVVHVATKAVVDLPDAVAEIRRLKAEFVKCRKAYSDVVNTTDIKIADLRKHLALAVQLPPVMRWHTERKEFFCSECGGFLANTGHTRDCKYAAAVAASEGGA